jgi:NADP-dependent 3-hydroxy acid dehydrogenase YdfG
MTKIPGSGSGFTPKNLTFLKLQVIIITGANVGLGFETALDLAKRGATLILACR